MSMTMAPPSTCSIVLFVSSFEYYFEVLISIIIRLLGLDVTILTIGKGELDDKKRRLEQRLGDDTNWCPSCINARSRTLLHGRTTILAVPLGAFSLLTLCS